MIRKPDPRLWLLALALAGCTESPRQEELANAAESYGDSDNAAAEAVADNMSAEALENAPADRKGRSRVDPGEWSENREDPGEWPDPEQNTGTPKDR